MSLQENSVEWRIASQSVVGWYHPQYRWYGRSEPDFYLQRCL